MKMGQGIQMGCPQGSESPKSGFMLFYKSQQLLG